MMKKIVKVLSTLFAVLLLASCGATPQATATDDGITIYLVRHGKTWFNTTGQVQGFADSPLTEAGIEGAQKAGEALKDVEFNSVYTGDLSRQRNTAKYIIEANDKNKEVPFYEHVGFQEWNYGGFEGMTNAEMWTPIMEANGFTFDEDWTDYDALVRKLGDAGVADAIAKADPLKAAENYKEITTRGQAALKLIVSENKSGNVLVVSSGGMIPTLMELALPGEYDGELIENSSVTVLKYKDGKYSLEKINDTSHL